MYIYQMQAMHHPGVHLIFSIPLQILEGETVLEQRKRLKFRHRMFDVREENEETIRREQQLTFYRLRSRTFTEERCIPTERGTASLRMWTPSC
jgi:hypothetical protein